MIRTLSRTSPEVKDFLKYIREDLKNHRVHLKFSKTRNVRFNKTTTTAAYFHEPASNRWGSIRIGTGNRKPITILTNLVHEYCHFIQWKNGDRDWINGNGDHIEGSRYVLLEERTEKEMISLMRSWNLPLNFSGIRKRSRSYIAWLRSNEIDT